ncbi:dihydrodipicolinate synthase family protein [Membranicola marinus]|uniref:Dihydrodipicolinate synthase family protein n=1 Tax=Membranihabitans marinus TaxID=1227546 RepID=A0A953HR60_9BACT|nr:dihydrodipicolinate synthase family protein [Membranihabitans marinus]MBY5956875.1 dihydrodipicolinate synthase family protein [Membranihabitans marinus]
MQLTGFFPAPFTPFDNNGKVNPSLIPAYADHLKKDGVAGVFVGGTTGEGLLLSVRERKEMAAAWIAEQDNTFQVIIHVGASSIEDAKELARHAASISATGISTMAPLFLKPQSVSALIDFCAKVAEEAPDLPFYYYHIPQVTAVDFMMVDFLEQVGDRIPNFAGLKYSGTDIMDVLLCAEFNAPKRDIIYGQDEKLLAGLVFGLQGAIGSTYNYMTPHYLDLVKAFESGDLKKARKMQADSATLVRAMNRYGGGIRVGKRIMKEIGLDCGGLRSPGETIPEKEWAEFLESEDMKELRDLLKI